MMNKASYVALAAAAMGSSGWAPSAFPKSYRNEGDFRAFSDGHMKSRKMKRKKRKR